jgi:hypothetical protein
VSAESAPVSLGGSGAFSGSDSLDTYRPRSRGWVGALTFGFVLLILGTGAGVGVYLWQSGGRGAGPAVATAPDATVAVPAIPAIPAGSADAGAAGAPRRSVIVSESGYSFQAVLPERPVAGTSYEIVLEIWDPAGEPLAVPEIVLTIEEPGGIERGLAAKLTERTGRYRFSRAFGLPGTHYLHVFPPTGNTNVKIWLDVAPATHAD